MYMNNIQEITVSVAVKGDFNSKTKLTNFNSNKLQLTHLKNLHSAAIFICNLMRVSGCETVPDVISSGEH